MERTVHPAVGPLRGAVRVPGDKSISHRAVIFASMAEGRSELDGVLDSADVRSTLSAVEALGASIECSPSAVGLRVGVGGWGRIGPTTPDTPIDCGNSGTTARLLMGVLAGWDVGATLTGDPSLSKRPMSRVTDPLTQMGARFGSPREGLLPVTVHGGRLSGIDYRSPVASAQVKTAVLLAGIRGTGRTSVAEPAPSRDHTERMLPTFGIDVGRDLATHTAWVDGPATPHAATLTVPGDPSSAAFIVVAATLVPGSEVSLPGIALNPTRAGFLRVLERMGAEVEVVPSTAEGEPVGEIQVRHATALAGTTVAAAEIPSLIDEVPVLAVAAMRARGTTRFEGVGELRVKESDRLGAIVETCSALGVSVRAGDDWLEIDGPAEIGEATLDSSGDHRLAMAFHVAGLVATGPVHITSYEAVEVSYPSFAADIEARLADPHDG